MRSPLLVAALVVATLSLAGCSASFDPGPATSQGSLGAISGTLYGGRQPVSGAKLFVFAAGTGGNAGPGLAASFANKSTSLLTSFSTGSYPTTLDNDNTSPTYGDYYVTTGAYGQFGITGEYACTLGTQVYLLALGGKPDGQTSNASAAFMAVLGNCPASGTLATQTPVVYMNEVSTIAAAYAIAGYATDATHVSSDNTALSQTGIRNAFANAAQLYDIGSATNNLHGATARATTLYGSGTVPQTLLNSLANSLAACVNSSGAASAQCTTLFSNAKSSGSSGTTPTDVATAAINIAHNPGSNVSNIFTLPSAIGYPYTPNLGTTTPNDFTVGLVFNPATTIYNIEDLAVDSSGNVWVNNLFSQSSVNGGNGDVVEFSPLGAVLRTVSTGGINQPVGIAIDAIGYAWVANLDSLTRITSSGSATKFVPSSFTSYGISPVYVAADASNNIWTTAYGPYVAEINQSGNDVVAPYSVGSVTYNIAIDHANNKWVNDFNTGALAKITSAGSIASYPSPTYCSGAQPAIDSSDYIWIGNGGTVSKVSPAGAKVGDYGANAGINACNIARIAVDGASNVWVPSNGGNATGGSTLAEVSNSGAALSPSTGYQGGNRIYYQAAAVDGSGNVWVSTNRPYTNSDITNAATYLVEFIGAAVPVVTPISPTYPGGSSTGLGVRP